MSKSNFFRGFKNEFGLTAFEYIQQERIRTVRQLLLNPQCTLSEVCVRTEFQDMSHFNRVVKKLTGHAPGALRQQLAATSAIALPAET